MTRPGPVLGVDGGTTKTVALVAGDDGTILGWARGAGSNLYEHGPQACRTIRDTSVAAARAAGVELDELSAAGLSLAGADTEQDVRFLEEAARAAGLGRARRVVNDSIGALYAASPVGAATVAVCGTGFAAGARSAAGHSWSGGHWTEWATSRGRGVLGGRAMAQAAVRAVVDEELGLGPSTSLTARLLHSFQVPDVAALLHGLTVREGGRSRPRSDVTGELLTAANEGDTVASAVVEDFGAAMGDLAAVAARRAGADIEPLELALMGSVLRAECAVLHRSLLEAFGRRIDAFEVIAAPPQPALGAVLIALELLGGGLSQAQADALAESCPPADLFDTTAAAVSPALTR